MAVMTYFACIIILKSSSHFNSNAFEETGNYFTMMQYFHQTAYKTHGIFGKRLVELRYISTLFIFILCSIIGLLFGMLIGFNVSISDMGSEVVATFTGKEVSYHDNYWSFRQA